MDASHRWLKREMGVKMGGVTAAIDDDGGDGDDDDDDDHCPEIGGGLGDDDDAAADASHALSLSAASKSSFVEGALKQ